MPPRLWRVSNKNMADDAAIARSKLAQELLLIHAVDLSRDVRKVSNMEILPSAPDGVSILRGNIASLGTASVILESTANSDTVYPCTFKLFLPENYVAGAALSLRLHAKKYVGGTNGYADVLCYKADGEAGVSADICATDEQTLTTSYADYDFTITPTGLIAGSELDFRINIRAEDANLWGPITIGSIQLLANVKG